MPRAATSVATQTRARRSRKRLERGVALILAVLARQRDRVEAALDQACMQAPHIVTGGAEEHRRLGIVEAQDVHHRILDIGRGDRDRLIADVAVAAILAHRGDAQRVLLVALGERDDRLGHRRREHHRPALGRRRVENLLQILAEAHVEHLVRLVEDRDAEAPQVERASFEMVAQAPRRANDNMRALRQVAALLGRIHAADAGRDPRARLAVEPDELAADLQRQLARRRDYQRHRFANEGDLAVLAQQLRRHGKPESNGFAGAGLRRDDEVPPFRALFEHGGLHGRGRGIATGGKRFGEKRRERVERHVCPDVAARPRGQGRKVQASGRIAIQLPPIRPRRAERATRVGRERRSPIAALTANAAKAARLPLRLIAPRLRQAWMCDPKAGCDTSQCSSRGLERAKQNAARITNGTVGRSGRNSPIPPSSSEIAPAAK
jgi:hypothetical protein